MKAEEFYKILHWFPGVTMLNKHDKQADIFDYHDLIDFATQFAEQENEELLEKIEDLEEQLNDDGEIPFVDIPEKTTRYKLTKINKK